MIAPSPHPPLSLFGKIHWQDTCTKCPAEDMLNTKLQFNPYKLDAKSISIWTCQIVRAANKHETNVIFQSSLLCQLLITQDHSFSSFILCDRVCRPVLTSHVGSDHFFLDLTMTNIGHDQQS